MFRNYLLGDNTTAPSGLYAGFCHAFLVFFATVSFWLYTQLQLPAKQEAFEKCWAHSPLRAATRCIAIHQVSLLSHAACASMSTTATTTTTTTRDRGDRYMAP